MIRLCHRLGIDISIKELAYTIKEIVGYYGKIIFDTKKPDGSPRKLMNINLIQKFGWRVKTNLKDGLIKSYADFLKIKIS